MWIVRLALRRPYTVVVFAIVILLLGAMAILTTPKDIFPNIDIPVVSVLWSYGGLSADEMAARIVTVHERALTTTVNDIEHMEAQSLDGIAVEKIFFQPGAQVANAVAQVTATSQAVMRQMPPGATPPLVITYSASSVPVLQLALSGEGLSEQQLNDFAVNFVRTDLATVRGASVPFPYGGKIREFSVPNPDGALLPGSYAVMHIDVRRDRATWLLPASALLFRSEGLRVVTVDGGGKAVLRPIETGRDLGTEVEVLAGLHGDEPVIVDPPDSIAPGERVRVARRPG